MALIWQSNRGPIGRPRTRENIRFSTRCFSCGLSHGIRPPCPEALGGSRRVKNSPCFEPLQAHGGPSVKEADVSKLLDRAYFEALVAPTARKRRAIEVDRSFGSLKPLGASVVAPAATRIRAPGVDAYNLWCCLPGARHRASNHFSSLRLLSTVFSMKWTPLAPS